MFRFFERLIDPYASYSQSDTPPKQLYPFLQTFNEPFRPYFRLAATLSVLVAVVEVALIYYLGRVVDLMGQTEPEQVWSTHGAELLGITLFILILRPAIQAASTLVLNNTLLPNYGTLIRWRAHRHVLRQSVGWFESDFAGRIANRIMQAPPAAGEAMFQVFDALAYAIAYMVGAALLLANADIRLTIPLLVWFALYIILTRWTVKRIGPASKAASDARSAVTGRVVDAYTNIHTVKLGAHHSREEDYAKEAIEVSRDTFAKEMRIFSIMDICLVFLNGFLIVGVVGWAISLWSAEAASIGIVAAATALTLRLNAMTGWIMWAVSNFFQNLGIISEGMETIAHPIALVDAPNAPQLGFGTGRIEFQALQHHYGKAQGGLGEINAVIEPGQKVGLVGRSGAGKTTLVKLLLRFYDPDNGRILIDGQDISCVTQDSLRNEIGMVQQDSALLHRSVRDNILYGRPDASDEDVVQAAKRAKAHEFILGLEDQNGKKGYDAQVGERGVKLSGGQRQRIALARVILKDAPLLVLDEATSALDSEVEAEIQATLTEMMNGKTVIAIAHRLSTIAEMDRILVLDDGRIVEDGTHAELLALNGLYAGFWQRQSGGFIGVAAR